MRCCGYATASALRKFRVLFARVGFPAIAVLLYLYLPSAIVSLLRSHVRAGQQPMTLSDYELEQLRNSGLSEPGYPAELYLQDLRGQEKDLASARERFQRLNDSSQCGNVLPKLPLLSDGTVGLPEQSLVEHISTEFVFAYNDYIRYAHMAMLAHWQGLLVAAWQAAPSSRNLLVKGDGSKEIVVEGLQDQRLLYTVSRDFGKTWDTPSGIQLSDSRSSELKGPVWSPVLHAAEDGRLWLFYSQSRECKKTVNGQVTWAPGGDIKSVTLKNVKSLSTAIFDSSDSPIWSMPKTLLPQNDDNGLPKVIANKMIVLTSGEWILPFWREKPDSESYVCMEHVMSLPSAGVLISRDDGAHWSVHGELRDIRTPLIEGSVVQLRNDSLLMLFRSASGCAWRSVSHDHGKTWGPAIPTHVPNPNSKAHVILLKQTGHLIMAYNNHKSRGSHLPTEDGQDNLCRSCRTALELAISADDGVSWRKLALIENEITPGIRIHYPTLQQVDDRLLVIYSKFYLYREPGEWSQEQGIKLATFNISGLLSTSSDLVLKNVPSQRLLINVVNHFIKSLSAEDITRIQMHGHSHRLPAAKRFEKRWRLLSTILCARYDFSHLGGQRWLFTKFNFGRYAVDKVWALPVRKDASRPVAVVEGATSAKTFAESANLDDVIA